VSVSSVLLSVAFDGTAAILLAACVFPIWHIV
jgi:hypothetical protein